MNRHLLLVAALLATTGTSLDAWAQAGRIQFTSGEVTVQRTNGRSIHAFKGLAVDEGDTVVTGGNGQAHLKMVDDALIALRANTALRVETYRYAGREDGGEQGVLGLLRGAFRSITGVIGRLNKDSYRVRTPTATIGIRGTDHETAYIPPDSPATYPDTEPGTYNLVHSGQTFIEANGQRIELAANQAGFAALAPNIAPTRLPVIPPFLRGPGFGAPGGLRPAAQRGTDGPRRPRPDLRPGQPGAGLPPPPPGSVPPPAPGTFDPRQLPPGFVIAAPGTPLVGGDVSPSIIGSGAGVVGSNPITGDTNFAVLNDLGLVAQFGSNGFNYARIGAPLVDQGSATVGSETVNWGVYAGGEIKDGLGVRQPIYFHHMVAGSITPPAALAAALGTGGLTFSTVGGFTQPIAENGAVGGGVFRASISIVDGGTSFLVTNYVIDLSDAQDRNWSAATPTNLPGVTLADFIGGSGMPLDVSCSTCAGGPTGFGSAHGVPIGATAPVGVISSYDLHVGTAAVTGSVLIQ